MVATKKFFAMVDSFCSLMGVDVPPIDEEGWCYLKFDAFEVFLKSVEHEKVLIKSKVIDLPEEGALANQNIMSLLRDNLSRLRNMTGSLCLHETGKLMLIEQVSIAEMDVDIFADFLGGYVNRVELLSNNYNNVCMPTMQPMGMIFP